MYGETPHMAAGTATAIAGDEQLLTRAVRHGDRDALNELFRRYRLVAYRVAYRLLGNEADALDAVQEAFVKALTHLSGFQGRSSFKTWLLRVVGNAALDLGRQRGRREAIRFDALGPQSREELEPMVFEVAGQDLERADLRRMLQWALDQLPVAQRQTFVLHAEAGLSYREVAGVLNISIGTVMSRLFYARQRLRVLLEAWTRTQ
jgi:RNA polymerase sigma-70 factor (ECF subfamily)